MQTFDPMAMQGQVDEAARLLKVLANGQRLRVLCLLVGHELTVGQLNEHMPELSQSALSQHLARLRQEDLVDTRRESQQIWYHLVEGPACWILQTLHGIYCDSTMSRLRRGVSPQTPSSNESGNQRVRSDEHRCARANKVAPRKGSRKQASAS